MVRGGLVSMLYSKTADLNVAAVNPSEAVILMSADIERITTGWERVHELWANLIEIGLAIYLLQRELGVACAIPVGVALCRYFLYSQGKQLMPVPSFHDGLNRGFWSDYGTPSKMARGNRASSHGDHSNAWGHERNQDVRTHRHLVHHTPEAPS